MPVELEEHRLRLETAQAKLAAHLGATEADLDRALRMRNPWRRRRLLKDARERLRGWESWLDFARRDP
ncbi:MAG TPA: hypothetical protein VFI54_06270 [Solirubrobacteraceae bacterium]|nr:hypothetical protein [Solirubrobacteraceae bacterium]